MQGENDPTVRRKKNFRARGSRGGARRKRENRHNQNQQINYQASQYYNNGYAAQPQPQPQPQPRHYQRNQNHQQYYYKQNDSAKDTFINQHHNYEPSNTYASMAYNKDLTQTQSWGSTIESSKESTDFLNNENLNPSKESILPHLPPPTDKANFDNANEMKKMSMAILPMKNVDQNMHSTSEKDNIFGDDFLRRSPSTHSFHSESTKLDSSIAIPDDDLDISSRNNAPSFNEQRNDFDSSDRSNGPSFTEQRSDVDSSDRKNGLAFADHRTPSEGLDIFSTMHPVFGTASCNHQHPTTDQRNKSFSHFSRLTSESLGGSYFNTSPRSFLMGK